MDNNEYGYLYELTKDLQEEDVSVISGNEQLNNVTMEPSVVVSGGKQQQRRDLIIKHADGVYRIWMDTFADFNINYVNKFCRFLDTRSPEDTVILYLGAHLEAEIIMEAPSILSSVLATPCKLHAVASGPSSAFETAMYCFAKTREMRRYGYITFTRPSYVKKYYEEWAHINRTIFERAVELGLLTDEQVREILEYNNTVVLTYNDLKNKE